MELKTKKALIIDDDEHIIEALKLALKPHFRSVDSTQDPGKIPALLHQEQFDILLLDLNFSRGNSDGAEGFHWLDQILEKDPTACVILMTAYGGVDTAVRAIKRGATDFMLKPWDNAKLLTTIKSSLKLHQSKRSTSETIEQTDLVAEAPCMKTLLSQVNKVSKTDANVLILGENGVGKDLIAKAIHNISNRNEAEYVKVDLGALSESLFESELFGHTKGAFTDAKEARIGRFQQANSGTIFLDEIGNLSLPLQAKLLTVLQNRKVTPLGASKEYEIDVRLISATNMPLHEMIGEKQFRQDLLYRINTIELTVPPLRERKEDIGPLIDHFIQVFCKKYDLETKYVSKDTLRRLEQYEWPGNVRELEHAVERAVILSEKNQLQIEDFVQSLKPKPNKGVDLMNLNLEDAEKVLIQTALEKHMGNISKAAQDLGLTRAALYRRIEKHNL
ncbi:MAG: sigma-54 dependent transcriptional regulator [Flavobacteriales bacterium]|nr:sigma-54 dependent transcriptional regulator [Flavobacteriales bacterium]